MDPDEGTGLSEPVKSLNVCPDAPLRSGGGSGGAGRAPPPGLLPGLGAKVSDPEGAGPTPFPVRAVTHLQQRDQRLVRTNQIPLQEPAEGNEPHSD